MVAKKKGTREQDTASPFPSLITKVFATFLLRGVVTVGKINI